MKGKETICTHIISSCQKYLAQPCFLKCDFRSKAVSPFCLQYSQLVNKGDHKILSQAKLTLMSQMYEKLAPKTQFCKIGEKLQFGEGRERQGLASAQREKRGLASA